MTIRECLDSLGIKTGDYDRDIKKLLNKYFVLEREAAALAKQLEALRTDVISGDKGREY